MTTPATMMNYSEFFEIDDEYFNCVNAELIKQGKVKWNEFYPHDAFIRLLKTTIDVIEQRETKSIQVEGAYGTGKSYSVLTIQKILDSDEGSVRAYCKKYNLSDDLVTDIMAVKDKKILTVYKSGSANINSDLELISTVQNSINSALTANGYEAISSSIQNSIVNWLSNKNNASYFNSKLAENNNSTKYKIESAEEVIKLLSLNDDVDSNSKNDYIKNVIDFSNENNVSISRINDIDDLTDWIKEVIRNNNLYCILFIWDEFTEFLINNSTRLTGLQNLLELSSGSFKMMIVTHQSGALFNGDSKSNFKKLSERLIPINITLPNNMALQLIGRALMNKKPEYETQWHEVHESLKNQVYDSTSRMLKTIPDLDRADLDAILPISPYAALILKFISSSFKANQRSMFEFIKDNSEELHGFKWYINNHNCISDENLLTVDMLWDFFYTDSSGLESDVRDVLSAYTQHERSFTANPEHARVFKTILLMRAMSNKDSSPILKPTDNNLKLAFDGVDLETPVANITKLLVEKYKVIMKADDISDEPEYVLSYNTSKTNEVEEKVKNDLKTITTRDIVAENEDLFVKQFDTSGLCGRCKISFVDIKNYKVSYESALRSVDNRFEVLMAFSATEDEHVKFAQMIEETDFSKSKNVIVVDCTETYLGRDKLGEYVKSRAWEAYYQNKDISKNRQHKKNREMIIASWVENIKNSPSKMFSSEDRNNCMHYSALKGSLKDYAEKRYRLCLDSLNVKRDNFFNKTGSFGKGIDCGIKQAMSGTFNTSTKVIENALSGLLKVDNYWTDPRLSDNLIVQIKKAVVDKADKCIEEKGRIPVSEIADMLMSEPYGFVVCDFSALMIGFLLKEYADINSYTISNGNTPTQDNAAALKNAIEQTFTYVNRKNNWVIKPLTANISNFYKVSSEIFNFSSVANVDLTVNYIRSSMNSLKYPFWALNYIKINCEDSDAVRKLIGLYTAIVKDQSGQKMEFAEQIGEICTPAASEGLKAIATKEHCRNGMLEYVHKYSESKGAYGLISEYDNAGFDILQELQQRTSSSGDSSWVWDQEIWDSCMNRIIDELHIIKSLSVLDSNINIKNKNTVIKQHLDSVKMPIDAISTIDSDCGELLHLLNSYASHNVENDLLSKLKDSMGLINKAVSILSDRVLLYRTYFTKELSKYDDYTVESIINNVPNNKVNPTTSLNDFRDLVYSAITKVENDIECQKLSLYWEEKTNSKNIQDWSRKNKTPISCIVRDNEVISTLTVALDGAIRDPAVVKRAMDILKNTDLIEKLNNPEIVDTCFRKHVLGQYSYMFENLAEVRDKLCENNNNPDQWVGNYSLIEKLAKSEYIEKGMEADVLSLVDSMNPDALKQFLKEKIQSNMNLAMEILLKKE